MKKAEKSPMTQNIEKTTHANPQVSKKTKSKKNEKNFLKAKDEQKKEVKEKEKQELIEKANRVNALYTPMEKAFDQMQKEIERDNKVEKMEKGIGELSTNENMDEEYEIIKASSLLNDDIKEIPMLIPPLFHSVGLALLIGSSDIGKSTLLRQLCISVVTGLPFLGMKIQSIYRRALYVSSEDDEMSTSFLLKKQNNEFMLMPEDLDGLSFIFETDNLLERLEKELQKTRVDVIVIDALTDLINSDLYKANDVRYFLNQYSQLAKKYQCLIIFLHHTRKNSENVAPSKNNSLGSQAIEAKSRLVLEFKANLNNPTIRHLCPVKGNYLPQELKKCSIDMMFTENLTFQSLGTNTPFDKINTNEVNFTKLETEYNEIISLKEQGLNYREIGLKLDISHSTVMRKIKTFEKLKNSETIVKDKN